MRFHHVFGCTFCMSYCNGTEEAEMILLHRAKQNYDEYTEKRLRCMNRPICLMHFTLSCMSCMYLGFPLSPPGSVCWWGLPRRTPPSLALWKQGPSITAPGLDSPTAANRYLLTIPVSCLKAFSIFSCHYSS